MFDQQTYLETILDNFSADLLTGGPATDTHRRFELYMHMISPAHPLKVTGLKPKQARSVARVMPLALGGNLDTRTLLSPGAQ